MTREPMRVFESFEKLKNYIDREHYKFVNVGGKVKI